MVATDSLVRLRLLTHNSRLVDSYKELGLTVPRLSRATGINTNCLSQIINLRRLPTDEQQIKIAVALGKLTDYLFPEELLKAISLGVFHKRTAVLATPEVIYLSQVQSSRLLTDGGIEEKEDEMFHKQLATSLDVALSTLSEKEQLVLRLRYSDSSESRTLDSVAQEMGVTRERIRQIEAKALHRLRHPSRSKGLKTFLDLQDGKTKGLKKGVL